MRDVLLALGLAGVHAVGPAGDVDDGLHQRLVERHGGVAEAADADLVAERLAQRLAEHDRGVLDGVVGVDVGVALGLDGQVDQRVPAERVEHVVVEADAGGDVGAAGAVEVDLDEDLRLLGLPLDRARSCSCCLLLHHLGECLLERLSSRRRCRSTPAASRRARSPGSARRGRAAPARQHDGPRRCRTTRSWRRCRRPAAPARAARRRCRRARRAARRPCRAARARAAAPPARPPG